MNNSFDVTTIVFAALALFVIWKLRSVLGTRTGHERPPEQQARPSRAADSSDKVVRLPGLANENQPDEASARTDAARQWHGLAEPGSPVWEGLTVLDELENGFDAQGFLEGAKGAYEMIVTAFAAGDRSTLRNLLSRDVYESFAQAISDRAARGERVETTFVSLDSAKYDEVQVRDGWAQITLSFESKLITATFDQDNKLIDGNPDTIIDVNDVWTFAREVGSGDHNWKLIAT